MYIMTIFATLNIIFQKFIIQLFMQDETFVINN